MGTVIAMTHLWLSGMTAFSSVTYPASTSSKTMGLPSELWL
jgi:hypothetical protein